MEENRRDAQRANLLLAGSIEAGPINAPVRIRNLSETGAAIDGEALPAPGSKVILRRLDLAVHGVVAWTSGTRCGIHFDLPTEITQWVTGSRTELYDLAEQARADIIQARVRTGLAPVPPLSTAPSTPAGPTLDVRLADEIAYVRALLERLGDELTDTPEILAQHATALQSFDLMGQILGHVANVLVAEDRAAAIAAIGMEELRSRLLGKPRS